jgi:alkanesulfonate monooxygenase SsuD/methylene tetrahydromethanopterin reductase-like flavin-dependent oxidoreductase (luciferase family)
LYSLAKPALLSLHHLRIPDLHRACLDGWSALDALAKASKNVRIGTMVTGNTYRHPAVLAKMATTVDIISGGRPWRQS